MTDTRAHHLARALEAVAAALHRHPCTDNVKIQADERRVEIRLAADPDSVIDLRVRPVDDDTRTAQVRQLAEALGLPEPVEHDASRGHAYLSTTGTPGYAGGVVIDVWTLVRVGLKAVTS